MRQQNEKLVFELLFKWSIGLLIVSIALASVTDYQWSALGILGWLSVPAGILLALLCFLIPVFWVSHHWLKLDSFYSLTQQLHEMCRDLTWPQIVVLSILAGISEELLFRGVLQTWLASVSGVYSGIFFASLIFGIMHAMSLYYFVYTFLLGLLFGLLFHFSQSMLMVATWHAVYDIIALGVIAKYPHLLGVSADTDDELPL